MLHYVGPEPTAEKGDATMNYVAAIDQEVSALPPEYQREVLDFVEYLRDKRARQAPADWIDRAWGASPDFPDRPAQPVIDAIETL
ncbi:MAG: DUF2281 domain-containing protein [Rhizobiales bacterium]|nr:DUF2281 domain-containing protein [Hyphomicrobiales bacterium]